MSEQVLVTGISGFIAKHIALNLLQQGYKVRGTVRASTHTDEVRQALQSHDADISELSFIEADLGSDAYWTEAAQDCAYVQHVALPFPMKQPRDRESLVPEARQGALRVLEAARTADVKRIVFTSSMVAMMYRANRARDGSNPAKRISRLCQKDTLAHLTRLDGGNSGDFRSGPQVGHPGHRGQTGRRQWLCYRNYRSQFQTGRRGGAGCRSNANRLFTCLINN